MCRYQHFFGHTKGRKGLYVLRRTTVVEHNADLDYKCFQHIL